MRTTKTNVEKTSTKRNA